MRNKESKPLTIWSKLFILFVLPLLILACLNSDKLFNTHTSNDAAPTTTKTSTPYHMDNKRVVAASNTTSDFKLVYKYPDPVLGQNVPPDTTTTTKPKKAASPKIKAAPKNSDTITTTTNKKGITTTIETKVIYINGVKHVTKTYLK